MVGQRPAVAGEGAPAAHTGEPLWMLRVNPLPRVRLADAVLAALLGEVCAAENEVEAAAELCSAELHQLIGATDDPGERGPLIALRRDIHNDRVPRGGDDPVPAVARWRAARTLRDTLRETLNREYPQAADRERNRLAGLLADDDLRCSLALVAPEVAAAADRYRAALDDEGKLSARLRKSERGLVQYVTRAMIRTSPLSRFTAVGLVPPGPRGVALGEVTAVGAVPVIGLDRIMLHYVLGGLRYEATPEGPVRFDDWVQLPPTSEFGPNREKLMFLQPAGGQIRRLSTSVAGPVRPMLNAVALGARQVSAVAAEVVGEFGCSAEDALTAVRGAVRAGILCLSDGPEDGELSFRTALDRPGLPSAPLLGEVNRLLPEVAAAPAGQRATVLTRLRGTLADLSHRAGRPAQVLVEEDYVLPSMTVDTAPWGAALDDLAAVVELLSVFDRLHDIRAVLSSIFVEWYGAGAEIPLAGHAERIAAEVYRRGGSLDGDIPQDGGPADGSLGRLHRLRLDVLARMRRTLTAAGPDARDVVLTAQEARSLVAALPDRFRQDPLAYGVLVQPWQDRLLFNDAYAGHGMLYGRFLGADRELGGRALPYLAERLKLQYGSDGRRVAEDLGLHRLNVNAHARVLPDGIDAEGWATLRLAHDPATDALCVRDAEGRDLRVLTLGSGHPEFLPAPVRIAAWLVSGGRLMEDFVGDWHASAGGSGGATQVCPRVSVGRAVLARRRWYGGAELAEAVTAGREETDRLRALARWRARHGAPAEVVLKTPLEDTYGTEALQAAAALGFGAEEHRQRQKPQYADLESAVSVRVLPRLMERRSPGYLEEALPAVADSRHAAEWVVEIARTAGAPFSYGGKTA
ncbi:lantibiotic biosynthesis dehydratase-like protein [Streptomyces brevispora]|uniref:Lantibiotic biosynthesis dehydratase-like protein n=1 Tax=Streptomyces brevispora TaxID=887462 RepID=A0A561V3T7_9ACTN|nr:lantibiotic biosynthesis dehydratase-like protein [Streptomyces brevispora]